MAMRTPSDLSRRRIDTAREKSSISTPSVTSSSSRLGDRVNQSGEVPVPELHRREVDGDLQVAWPRRRFAAGGAQYPLAHRHDQSAFLGERDEHARRNSAPKWVLPARQRLKTDDFAVDPRLRLIMQAQLVA